MKVRTFFFFQTTVLEHSLSPSCGIEETRCESVSDLSYIYIYICMYIIYIYIYKLCMSCTNVIYIYIYIYIIIENWPNLKIFFTKVHKI